MKYRLNLNPTAEPKKKPQPVETSEIVKRTTTVVDSSSVEGLASNNISEYNKTLMSGAHGVPELVGPVKPTYYPPKKEPATEQIKSDVDATYKTRIANQIISAILSNYAKDWSYITYDNFVLLEKIKYTPALIKETYRKLFPRGYLTTWESMLYDIAKEFYRKPEELNAKEIGLAVLKKEKTDDDKVKQDQRYRVLFKV